MNTRHVIASVLRWGSRAALVLTALGGFALASRGFPLEAHRALTQPFGSAQGLAEAGLVALMLTPAARVLVAAVGFFSEKDSRHGWAAVGVLALLLAGSFLGAAH